MTAPLPDLIRTAQNHQRLRQKAAATAYKNSLELATDALQTTRMLDALTRTIETRRKSGANILSLSESVSSANLRLQSAMHPYNALEIQSVHSDVLLLTQTHFPAYFQSDAARRKTHANTRRRAAVPQATWRSNPSSRFISVMRGDFQAERPVSEEEQRSCVSSCAWIFSIIGMIVAISFLIADFWSAQINPAISTVLMDNSQLQLPTIFACLAVPHMPAFEALPNNEYAGQTLWGLRSYSNAETGELMRYPDTTRLVSEPSFIGEASFCNDAMSHLSMASIEEGMNPSADPSRKCYSCIRIGAKKPMVLSLEGATNRTAGAVTLEFSISQDISFCFSRNLGYNSRLKDGIKEDLKAQGKELVEKGIVEIIPDPDGIANVEFALDNGFEPFKKAFPRDRNIGRLKEIEVLCNLYFFSGHFFPVKNGNKIRYSYNISAGIDAWKPIGNPINFRHMPSIAGELQDSSMNRTEILQEIRQASSMFHTSTLDNSISIYSVTNRTKTQPAFMDFTASIQPNQHELIMYTKRSDDGYVKYLASVQAGAKTYYRQTSRFLRFTMSLDFETFASEVVTRRPTTSIAEFCTDIFEYAGLFTGVCAYSVLVGPARMYLKRSKPRGRSH